jgi:AcrR family transcriptional regulator
MSLREKYKVMVHDSILESALELISNNGFAKTTIEMIAERSGVGVGTVYNHFPSKNDLLIAFIELKTDEKMKAGKEIIAKKHSNPVDAISELIWVYVLMVFTIPHKVFQEGFAFFLTQSDTMGRKAAEDDESCAVLMQQMADKLQTEGLLAADTNLQAFKNLLWACKEYVINRRLFNENYTMEQAEVETKEMVELLWKGLKS